MKDFAITLKGRKEQDVVAAEKYERRDGWLVFLDKDGHTVGEYLVESVEAIKVLPD